MVELEKCRITGTKDIRLVFDPLVTEFIDGIALVNAHAISNITNKEVFSCYGVINSELEPISDLVNSSMLQFSRVNVVGRRFGKNDFLFGDSPVRGKAFYSVYHHVRINNDRIDECATFLEPLEINNSGTFIVKDPNYDRKYRLYSIKKGAYISRPHDCIELIDDNYPLVTDILISEFDGNTIKDTICYRVNLEDKVTSQVYSDFSKDWYSNVIEGESSSDLLIRRYNELSDILKSSIAKRKSLMEQKK